MIKSRRVAIALRTSGAAGRDVLASFFTTAKMLHWYPQLYQTPHELVTPEQFRNLERENFDGLVISETSSDAIRKLLVNYEKPLVYIGQDDALLLRKHPTSFVRINDEQIGAYGAQFLLSLGSFRSFGFVCEGGHQYWSEHRLCGFLDHLRRLRIETHVFDPDAGDATGDTLRHGLCSWLENLPKPAAVMCAWDATGVIVLRLCSEAGIRVPEQIAVIGVDNDELLDESSEPRLTSIQPDHNKLGECAARILDKLIRHKSTPQLNLIPTNATRIVERESAVATPPATNIINRAMDFIRQNATRGIGVDDVVRFLGVSRRLADLRFSQFNDETINEAIVRVRLESVCRLLAKTQRPIKAITADSGFSSPVYAKRLFKRRFGMTMREYRATNGGQ